MVLTDLRYRENRALQPSSGLCCFVTFGNITPFIPASHHVRLAYKNAYGMETMHILCLTKAFWQTSVITHFAYALLIIANIGYAKGYNY